MSIISEAERIKGNIENAYKALADRGAVIPEQQNSANLPAAIQSIPNGQGESENLLLAPVYVYNYKSDNTSTLSNVYICIKINVKGRKNLKISGRYTKTKGGCKILAVLYKSAQLNSNNNLSFGEQIDKEYLISGAGTETKNVSGEYSHVFVLENAECDEAYILLRLEWARMTGASYYGAAVLVADEIIVS